MSQSIWDLIFTRKKELESQEWILQRREPETLKKRSWELTQQTGPKEKLEGAIEGDDDLVIRTELVGGVGKYGRLLGWAIHWGRRCVPQRTND